MWKKLILGLLGLVVLLVLVGFLLPGKTEVSRSLTVNAPAEYSFEEVNVLPNWQKWSYWNSLDPTMKVTYGEKVAGEGSSYAWTSKDMGDGKLTITESIPNTSIKADLDFMENGTAKAWYTFEPEGEGTKVTMGFNTEYGMNPMMRWIGFVMMKSEMNKAFDYNLNKIKELAEAKPKFAIKISEESVAPISYVGVSSTMDPRDMAAVMKQMSKSYSDLFGMLKKSKVEMNGNPFCLFPKYSAESMDMVCALPVAPDAKLPAKYKVAQTSGGKAVKATHNGAYDKLEATHNELNKYIAFKKLQISGAPWEVYVTDPMVEKDTAKWVTEVYYPVASN
jgi:effector-binding domain-containing protein